MIPNVTILIAKLTELKNNVKFMEGALTIEKPITHSNVWMIDSLDVDEQQDVSDKLLEIEESGHVIFDKNTLIDDRTKAALVKAGFNVSGSGSSAAVHLDDDIWFYVAP